MLIGYFFYIRLSPGYFEKYDGTIVNLIIGSISLLLALWMFEQWKWLKTLKTEKANAELALLKSQINPHFFFNTLNNLYGLTVEKSDKAPEVVLKLSGMMRYTIYEGKKEVVPLKDEIQYLRNYIELQRLRYQKAVDISFEHEVDKDYDIAPLLFIILLENAFKHVVESVTEDAYVRISLNAKDGTVTFGLENNFEAPKIIKSVGIGLDNLNRRLKLIYPNSHMLNIADYLLKPFGLDRFIKAINKALGDKVEKKPDPASTDIDRPRLFIKGDKKHHQVLTEDILFVEANGNYTKLHLEKEMIISHEKISDFENLLHQSGFIRVQKSFIVALDKIGSIEGNLLRD